MTTALEIVSNLASTASSLSTLMDYSGSNRNEREKMKIMAAAEIKGLNQRVNAMIASQKMSLLCDLYTFMENEITQCEIVLEGYDPNNILCKEKMRRFIDFCHQCESILYDFNRSTPL